MAAAAIPAIISAGGSIAGGLLSRRGAPKASAAEQAAFGAAAGAGRQSARAGRGLFDFGARQLEGASQFLTPLLQGDRGAALAATSPERGQIKSFFRGAGRRIQEETRGGVRDLAKAQNIRDEAATLANVIPSLRTGAAATAAQLGTQTTAGGIAGIQGGGSIFAQLAGALQSGRISEGQLNALFSSINRQSGVDIGQGIFEIIQASRNNTPAEATP